MSQRRRPTRTPGHDGADPSYLKRVAQRAGKDRMFWHRIKVGLYRDRVTGRRTQMIISCTTEEMALKRLQEMAAMVAKEQVEEARDRCPRLPTITCLCGSTRFHEEFNRLNEKLTLEGHIVLSIGCHTSGDDAQGYTVEQKAALDELHLCKIDLADEVFIINKGGYIGESTRNEIRYANRQNKTIRWLEPKEVADGGGGSCQGG